MQSGLRADAARLAAVAPGTATDTIAWALLGFATITIAVLLLLRTLAGLVRGELRTLSA